MDKIKIGIIGEDPKEFLKEKSKKKYSESDNPEIFKKVNIVNLINNCKFFKRFTESFEKYLNLELIISNALSRYKFDIENSLFPDWILKKLSEKLSNIQWEKFNNICDIFKGFKDL